MGLAGLAILANCAGTALTAAANCACICWASAQRSSGAAACKTPKVRGCLRAISICEADRSILRRFPRAFRHAYVAVVASFGEPRPCSRKGRATAAGHSSTPRGFPGAPFACRDCTERHQPPRLARVCPGDTCSQVTDAAPARSTYNADLSELGPCGASRPSSFVYYQ